MTAYALYEVWKGLGRGRYEGSDGGAGEELLGRRWRGFRRFSEIMLDFHLVFRPSLLHNRMVSDIREFMTGSLLVIQINSHSGNPSKLPKGISMIHRADAAMRWIRIFDRSERWHDFR